MEKKESFILWFSGIGKEDIALVGGKNASLGEMIQQLSGLGIAVPPGFAITAYAYRYFIKDVEHKIRDVLSGLDTHDIKNLSTRGKMVRELIKNTPYPDNLKKAIVTAYKEFAEHLGKENPDVAVRSSATAEDLPNASFAGQQETFLNVRGEEELLIKARECFASLFTDRAISYRENMGFDHFNVYLSVGVQKMVRSGLAAAGVIFTLDTESGFRDVVYITGSWGLGEFVVQGTVTPDQFYVHKPTLNIGFQPIIEKRLGVKDKKLIYKEGESGTIPAMVSKKDQERFTLEDDEILTLARWALAIEDHYGRAMDIEWAKDGENGNLYIVQARPETVHSKKTEKNNPEEEKTEEAIEIYVVEIPRQERRLLLTGEAVGDKVGQGEANIILDPNEMWKFKRGQVLVTHMTNLDWEPIMKIAAAIITERGGRTCHAAIVSREFGIPCVIATGTATSVLRTGTQVTVDCSEGTGEIYEGLLPYHIERHNIGELPETKTQIMMNIGFPEKAFMYSKIPARGVGLARVEFIINSFIGIHPLALIDYKKLVGMARAEKAIGETVRKIRQKTRGYKNKAQFFVDRFAMGIAKIAAAFYPHDVIVRFSDFKTNEYRNLIGGELYEPHEENPMMGWRGASRYYKLPYKPAFGLEVAGVKKVREEMGLTNVKVMIPFCRTPEEGERVLETMREFGLVQGENSLEVYVMAEIPSNVLQAGEFAEIFDGFSIGSNDLTQLTLGLDRDSALVADIYDERNSSVKKLISEIIMIAHQHKRKIGICGQAPSDFPDFAEFLVECGIDSISLNPDTVLKTRLLVAKKEKELQK